MNFESLFHSDCGSEKYIWFFNYGFSFLAPFACTSQTLDKLSIPVTLKKETMVCFGFVLVRTPLQTLFFGSDLS